MKIEKIPLPTIVIQPMFMPFIGLLFGLFIWFLDAVIDVYVLGEEQDLVSNILRPDELSELWMRILVVAVFLVMGFFSRYVLLKHIKLDLMLLEYQKKLEETVELRTSELLSKTTELEFLASTDPLTGLYNRRKFDGLFEQEIRRFKRYRKPLCLFLIDIDHFKLINDEYGHDVGDEVLIELAKVLRAGVRISDVVARWGGEEFMLLGIELDQSRAKLLAEKLRKFINQRNFQFVGKITVSIGIAQIRDDESPEAIQKRVDQALYAAKDNGRDCIVSFAEMDKVA